MSYNKQQEANKAHLTGFDNGSVMCIIHENKLSSKKLN